MIDRTVISLLKLLGIIGGGGFVAWKVLKVPFLLLTILYGMITLTPSCERLIKQQMDHRLELKKLKLTAELREAKEQLTVHLSNDSRAADLHAAIDAGDAAIHAATILANEREHKQEMGKLRQEQKQLVEKLREGSVATIERQQAVANTIIKELELRVSECKASLADKESRVTTQVSQLTAASVEVASLKALPPKVVEKVVYRDPPDSQYKGAYQLYLGRAEVNKKPIQPFTLEQWLVYCRASKQDQLREVTCQGL